MGKYILKRIAVAIPVLIGITVIDYALMCLAGSPLDMLTGPRVSEGALAARRSPGDWTSLLYSILCLASAGAHREPGLFHQQLPAGQ